MTGSMSEWFSQGFVCGTCFGTVFMAIVYLGMSLFFGGPKEPLSPEAQRIVNYLVLLGQKGQLSKSDHPAYGVRCVEPHKTLIGVYSTGVWIDGENVSSLLSKADLKEIRATAWTALKESERVQAAAKKERERAALDSLNGNKDI